MATVLSFVLVAACLIFVGWPFFSAEQGDSEPTENPLSPLEKQKRDAYALIREAEFDLHMGKLSENEFAALKENYRRQALVAIAALEKARAHGRRERAAVPGKARVKASFCPDCGWQVRQGAKFCGSCGRALADLAA
jgi:hypothetical protein